MSLFWTGAAVGRTLLSQVHSGKAPIAKGSDERGSYLYFGIVGMEADTDSSAYGSREFAFFERSNGASEADLFRTVSDRETGYSLVRYFSRVTFQLAVARDWGDDEALSIAHRLVSALRVKTGAEILVPAMLSISWNDLNTCPPAGCTATLLEDAPVAWRLEGGRQISSGDFDWLWEHGEKFDSLYTDASFRLAVEALCYHHQYPDLRMMAAALWAGMEAIFKINAELRFRIALMVATLLEAPGPSRIALHRRVQQLYDVRSKAVHGVDMIDAELEAHVVEVRALLGRLLTSFVERGSLPNPSSIEEMLLT